MNTLKILILHALRQPERIPRFLKDPVLSLPEYFPEHTYIYHEATPQAASLAADLEVDAILLHASFLSIRCRGANEFATLRQGYDFIGGVRSVKLAFPQGEYDCSQLLDDWMCDWNIDIVYSVCVENSTWLYPRYSKIGTIQLAYSVYIEKDALFPPPSPWHHRPVDIGYRESHLPAYLGRLGETRWRIGDYVDRLARSAGLVTDILLGDHDTIDECVWMRFVRDCKFTLGAPTGSSVLDLVGSIRMSVTDYLSNHRNASFDDVQQACLLGLDGRCRFEVLSPRVIVAGLQESGQILVEGDYGGILKPWEHYIPIQPDASNFSEVCDAVRDPSFTEPLIKNCKRALLETEALWSSCHAQKIVEFIANYRGRAIGPAAVEGGSAEYLPEASLAEKFQAKPRVLLLAAHEPPRDPRLDWIASGGRDRFVVHQLGISRVIDDQPREAGSDEKGWVRSYPRVTFRGDLNVISSTVFSLHESAAMRELSSLIAILSLDDRELMAILGSHNSQRVLQFRWYVKYLLQMTFSLASRAEHLSDIEAVIATDLDTLLAGIVLKERWGVPLIYDAHEFWPAANVEQEAFEYDFWVALEGRLVKYVDYAQTVSPGLAAHMASLYGVPFTCVPNAEPFRSGVTRVDSEMARAHGASACRFLFQGGFAPARGIDLLISAWPHTHPSAILVLRGPDGDYKQQMIDLALSLGLLGNRILFLPSVDESELVSGAVEFDVGLIPYTPTGLNYANCCPNKLSQYMAAGLPILASRTNFVHEVLLRSGAGVVVDFSEQSELIREIDRLTLHPGVRVAYARSAATFFQKEFHWEQVSKVFYAQLGELVLKPASPLSAPLGPQRLPSLFPEIFLPEPVVSEEETFANSALVTEEPPGNDDSPASLWSSLLHVSFRVFRRFWILLPLGLRTRVRTELKLWIQ